MKTSGFARVMSLTTVLLLGWSPPALAGAPQRFCDCPQHTQPAEAASASDGTDYRLHVYNDAYKSAPDKPWCYTRAVWFDRVRSGGRFEWRASTNKHVMWGPIEEIADPCGAYYNHYDSTAAPSKDTSTIEHGPTLEVSKDIALYYATDEEFQPSWAQGLWRRVSSLGGSFRLPGANSLTRVVVRVVSPRVTGSAPPYSIEYEISSPSYTSLNLTEFGKGPAAWERFPRLYWEAAVSRRFFDEMDKRRAGFIEGAFRATFKVQNVPGVEAAIGRLMILAPGSPPPKDGESLRGVLLIGTGTAFRAVDIAAPRPPENLGIR